MKRHVLAVCAMLALVSGAAHAIPFDRIPLISNTLGDVQNRLCSGAATPAGQADIACPSYSPYLTSGGLLGIGTATPTTALEVSGTVSATHFVGDGSGLTNLSVQGDRITSGTSNVTVNSATSTISFTTNGSVANYVDSSGRFVVTGISTTSNQASFTTINVANSPVGDASSGMIYKNGSPFISTYRATNTDGLNTFMGQGSGNTTMARSTFVWDASYNTGIGYYTLHSNTSGYNNTAVGQSALASNTTGYWNTAVGNVAPPSNTTGFGNTAVGEEALYTDATGSNNTALGDAALGRNLSGASNVAVGRSASFFATGNSNTTVGTFSLMNNTTGVQNVAMGTQAGYGVFGSTVVNDAVLLGFHAGYGITTSQKNTIIGSMAGTSLTTGSNDILIGYNTDAPAASTSDYLNIGNAISGSMLTTGTIGFGGSVTVVGNTGIGTLTPTTPLEVSGTISATHFVGDGSGLTGVTAAATDRITSGSTQMVVVSNTGYVSLTQAGTNTGWFDPTRGLVTLGVSATGGLSGTTGYFSGNVGVGTSSPTATLQVSGSFIVSSTGQTTTPSLYVGTNGNVGIGTTSPQAPLHVYSAGTTNTTLPGFIFQRSDTTGETHLQHYYADISYFSQNLYRDVDTNWYLNNTSHDGAAIVLNGNTSIAPTGIIFATQVAASGGHPLQPRMSIDINGGVEIGSYANVNTTSAGNVIISGKVGIGTTSPSKTLHVSGTVLTTSWTGINFSSAGNVTPVAPLEVSGTVSATRFVGDGSGLTGIASGDRITSGTASVIANQNTGVSVSAPMDVSGGVNVSGSVGIGTNNPQATLDVSGSIKLSGTGTEVCDAAHVYMLVIDPSTSSLLMCRP